MRRSVLLGSGALTAIVPGILFGVGSYTFHYGEGWSYFSKNPESCINCHVMQPHYDGWLASSHHAAATCADCHLPQHFPWNLIAKADNGWNHSWAFTFQNFHEPIVIKPRNLRILEANCRACHAPLVAQMLATGEAHHGGDGVSCLHCHADVGHRTQPH